MKSIQPLFLTLFVLIPSFEVNAQDNSLHIDSLEVCIESDEKLNGMLFKNESYHFQIELPEHWNVIIDGKHGISSSDTTAALEDYDLITISEFNDENFSLEQEYNNFYQYLSNDNGLEILHSGETNVARYTAKWILVIDIEIEKILGEHARILYLLQVQDTDYYYIIVNESYGTDKYVNLCTLQKIVNTFRFLE